MRCLIVEDDRKLALFLSRALSEEGYTVDICGVGTDVPCHDANLPDVIGNAEKAISEEMRTRDVRLAVQVPDVMVRTRRTDLERMFRNLFENAIRHSRDGGRVVVTVSTSDATVSVFVTDSGSGIAPADRPRVFEPFWRGVSEQASDAPGAGLGLAIARKIARAHGGEIELADTPDEGATFRITLPIAAQLAHASATPQALSDTTQTSHP